MKKLITLLSILFLFSSCNKDNLVGTWERQDEALQGMKVKVFKTDNSMYAQITDKGVKGDNFNLNETKWKNIKKVGNNEYELEDLSKGYYSSDAKYTQSHLKLQGEMLTIDLFYSDGSRTGTHQVWTRVKEQ